MYPHKEGITVIHPHPPSWEVLQGCNGATLWFCLLSGAHRAFVCGLCLRHIFANWIISLFNLFCCDVCLRLALCRLVRSTYWQYTDTYVCRDVSVHVIISAFWGSMYVCLHLISHKAVLYIKVFLLQSWNCFFIYSIFLFSLARKYTKDQLSKIYAGTLLLCVLLMTAFIPVHFDLQDLIFKPVVSQKHNIVESYHKNIIWQYHDFTCWAFDGKTMFAVCVSMISQTDIVENVNI